MFILSEHRGSYEALADGVRRYQAYLAERQDTFPPSAYALATADWYVDPRDHRCPHDAWLEAATLAEPASGERQEMRTVELRVRLLGAYHDGHIELRYRDVVRYECVAPAVQAGHGDWLWDEFRQADAGGVVHEIEWRNGGRWLIEAADVEYQWLPQVALDRNRDRAI